MTYTTFSEIKSYEYDKTEVIDLPASKDDTRKGYITRFTFDNDWQLSIANHTAVNGGDADLFSVALMNEDGKIFTSPEDPTSRWTEVKENLTWYQVRELITEVQNYNDCYFI